MSGERPMVPDARPRERLEWIDAAKGIGIVAVVVGHVWTRGAVRDAVYAFHMPLFFLLSGYLFRPQPSLPFMRKQLATQGVSYVAWLAVAVACDMWIEGMRGHRPIFHDWPTDLWRVAFGGSELRGPFTVFWFVPCLLTARILCNFMGRRFPERMAGPWIVAAALGAVLAYSLGVATDVSPLGLLTVPMAFALLWAGWAWAGVEWRPLMWTPLAVIALVVIVLVALAFAPPLNMKAGEYGWPVVSMAGAIAISFLIFRIARLPVVRSRPVRWLGGASLTIMYMHVPIVHYLSPYLDKPLLLGVAVLLPLAVHHASGANKITARLFLGRAFDGAASPVTHAA